MMKRRICMLAAVAVAAGGCGLLTVNGDRSGFPEVEASPPAQPRSGQHDAQGPAKPEVTQRPTNPEVAEGAPVDKDILSRLRAIEGRYQLGVSLRIVRHMVRACGRFGVDRAFLVGNQHLAKAGGPQRRTYVRANNVFRRFERQLEPHRAGAGRNFAKHASRVRQRIRALRTQKTFRKRSFHMPSTLNRELNQARVFLAIVQATQGNLSPIYVRGLKILETIARETSTLKRDAVATRAAPRQHYKGRDSRALRSRVRRFWEKRYPKDRVRRVYLVGRRWKRKRGRNWVPRNRGYVQYDVSWLEFQLATTTKGKDPKLARIWTGYIRKNHLDSNAIDQVDAYQGVTRSHGTILVSKLR